MSRSPTACSRLEQDTSKGIYSLFDVIIIGAGVAGACIANVLGRAGYKVALIDAGNPLPEIFKTEVLGTDQVNLLSKMGLLDAVRSVATRIRLSEEAWRGAKFKRQHVEHYSLPYAKLVVALREYLPENVVKLDNYAVNVITQDSGSKVVLEDGESINGRLVVLATGASGKLGRKLGSRKTEISKFHSITFGANLVPSNGQGFDFDELTCWGDKEDGIMLATFFPFEGGTRLNLVTHWPRGDQRIADFLCRPTQTLKGLMPHLESATGAFEIVGNVDACPVHVSSVEKQRHCGIVFCGDAYSVCCPGVGSGVKKVLHDSVLLSQAYIPQWLSYAEIDEEAVSEFYADPARVRMENEIIQLSLRSRRTAVDPGIFWKVRRWFRSIKRHGTRIAANLI